MPLKNVIITNKQKLFDLKKRVAMGGVEKLHVVSDFDKTLTQCFVDGQKIPSLISILRDEKYLTPDYAEKAQALYDKYHPMEIDPKISPEDKKKLMHQWWSEHYDLLIASWLSKKDLEKVSESKKIALRGGAVEFLDFLDKHNIPLVILSAAGLGYETIQMYLQKQNALRKNIRIVSNELEWNEDGKAVSVKEPIIHTFNKNYATVKNLDFFQEIKDRKNVILLGDGEGDAAMLEGFDCENVIKIGFLDDETFKSYPNIFDVVILNDSSMDFVNSLMKKLIAVK